MADEDLEWSLKLDADTSGAARMEAVLNKLDKTLGTLGDKLGHGERQSEKLGGGLEKAKGHAETLREAFHKLISNGLEPFMHYAERVAEFEWIRIGAEKLLEFPGELAEKVKELGEEMIMTAAKAERFDAAFKGALGREPGEQLLGYISKVAKHTEFTQNELKGMNLELAKAGFKGTGIGRGLEAAIDLASMSPDAKQGGQEAISALSRLMISGRLESRALVPFGISQNDLFAELSKETGHGRKALQKEMSEGKLNVETALNSIYTLITKKTGKALGGAGADMETLLTTRLKNLQEIPELIYEKMKDTEGFGQISDFIGNLADKLDPNGEIGGHIVDGLGEVFNRVGQMLKDVDLNGTLQMGLNILEEMPDVVEGLTKAFEGMVSTVKPVIDAMGWVADKVLGPSGHSYADVPMSRSEAVEELVSRRLRFEQQARKQLGGAYPVEYGPQETGKARLDKLRAEASEALTKGGTLDVAAKAMADSFMGTLRDRMKLGQDGVQKSGEAVGGAVETGVRKSMKMRSPSRVMQDLADQAVGSFADRIMDNADRVEMAMRQVVAVPGRGRGMGAGGVQIVISPQISVTGGGGQSADEIAASIAEKLKNMAVGEIQSALEQLAMQTGSAAA